MNSQELNNKLNTLNDKYNKIIHKIEALKLGLNQIQTADIPEIINITQEIFQNIKIDEIVQQENPV